MKKIITLAIVLLPLFSFSQDTIRIPKDAAKSIIKDLIECEGDKKELQLTKEHVGLLEQKVIAKDSIITYYEAKSSTFIEQLQLQKEKTQVYKDSLVILNNDNKKLKLKLFLNQLGAGAIIGVLTFVLVFK